MRGRGPVRSSRTMETDRLDDRRGHYEEYSHVDDGVKHDGARSIEGWVIIVTNLHEETPEEDLHETFSEFGNIKDIHLILDRRTGFVKGYALIEYPEQDQAEAAIRASDRKNILGQQVRCGWAFKKPLRMPRK